MSPAPSAPAQAAAVATSAAAPAAHAASPGAGSPSGWAVRPATPADVPEILAMIRELAEFEQLAHLMQATVPALTEHLFGPRPWAEALVVDAPEAGSPVAQQAAGSVAAGSAAEGAAVPLAAFALYFHNYSTFLARPGLYLEDMYVRPAHRGQGLGRHLLSVLARQAVARGCGRFEWSVLDWNQRAIEVYRAAGAELLPDWRICRVTGAALEHLARRG